MDIGPRKNTQVPVVPSRSNAFNPLTGQSIRVGPPDFKRFFVVEQIDGDYLLCVDEKSNLTIVALPFALQESALYNNGQEYVWGEIGILKNSLDVAVGWQQARTVDEVSEVIAPAYMLGEPILAMRLINDTDPSVKWVDVNASGRFWANVVNNTAGFVKIFRRSLEGTHKRMSWVYAVPALGDRSRIAVLLEDLPDPYTHDTIPEGIAFREDDFRADYALASLGNGFSVDTATTVPAIDQDVYYVPSPDIVGTWITKTREEILALDYFSILDTSSKTTTDVWQLNNIWHYRGGCFAAINFKDINRAGNGIVVDTEGMIRLDANVPTGSVTGQMALVATGNGNTEFQSITAPEGGVDVSSGSLSIAVDLETFPGEAIVSLFGDDEETVTAPALYFGNTGDVRGFKLIDSAGGIELNASDKIALKAIANPTSPTEMNPQSIAIDASATEAIYTDTWTAGSTGVKVWVHTRSGYYDAGDEKLYGYRRPFIYDKLGRLYSIGAEVRYLIDEPVEIP